MADFYTAHKAVMVNEGGYVFDKDDLGGETYKGIARNKHPHWTGWLLIDSIKRLNPSDLNAALDLNLTLQSQILAFYKSEFWNIFAGDQIVSQNVAESIYDSAVNMGPGTAIKLVQDIAFSLPNQDLAKKAKIKDLGIYYGSMDKKTLDKINNAV